VWAGTALPPGHCERAKQSRSTDACIGGVRLLRFSLNDNNPDSIGELIRKFAANPKYLHAARRMSGALSRLLHPMETDMRFENLSGSSIRPAGRKRLCMSGAIRGKAKSIARSAPARGRAAVQRRTGADCRPV